MNNLKDTIMAQYANSPAIIGIIEAFNDAIAPDDLITDFYNKVWNLATAQGFGLDIWGRIVGIGRTIQMNDPLAKYFGFNNTGFTPFNTAPFSGSGTQFQSYSLPDTLYRQLIIYKAASNIVYATAPNINKLLYAIFQNRAYYLPKNNMSASYVFEFTLNAFQKTIVYNLNILPVPCGISITYFEVDTELFGFNEAGYRPFDQGVFTP